jgi:hypothetical protein
VAAASLQATCCLSRLAIGFLSLALVEYTALEDRVSHLHRRNARICDRRI